MTTPPDPPAPRALFLGDSYTSGWALASADVARRWTTLVADAHGWEELNAGFPGAGYVASGPVSRAPYRAIIPTLAEALPDVVVMSGGLNDLYADDARIAKAARGTVRVLATTFPGAVCVVLGAVSPGQAGAAVRLAGLNAALLVACAEHGVAYLDLGEPLGVGVGLVGPDGIHPTVAGHASLAAAFDQAWEASGLVVPGKAPRD